MYPALMSRDRSPVPTAACTVRPTASVPNAIAIALDWMQLDDTHAVADGVVHAITGRTDCELCAPTPPSTVTDTAPVVPRFVLTASDTVGVLSYVTTASTVCVYDVDVAATHTLMRWPAGMRPGNADSDAHTDASIAD
jgi:hypothetical protein